MQDLNYHFLRSFWTVAKEGSVVRACQTLLLAQPTVSGQIRELENSLGQKLFTRAGRGLMLTEMGRLVFRYADEIFVLGKELQDVAGGQRSGRALRLVAGVADAIPKMLAYRFLEPAMAMPEVHVVCHEGKTDQLMVDLAMHHLDLVISDSPMGVTPKIRAFGHLLGETTVTIVGVPALAEKFRKGFPASLNGAPFFLPVQTALRRSLDQWFDEHDIRPLVRAEFDDSALLKFFGREGGGLFVVPTAVEADVCRQFNVRRVGLIESLRERFYATTVERRIRHPAATAICNAAQKILVRS